MKKATLRYDKEAGPCSAEEGKCGKCKKAEGKMQVCGGCKAISYCSKACQRKDWVYHRTVCTLSEILPLMGDAVDGQVASRALRNGQGFWRVEIPTARGVVALRDALSGPKAKARLLAMFKHAPFVTLSDVDLFKVTRNSIGMKAAVKMVQESIGEDSSVDLHGILLFLKLGQQSQALLMGANTNREISILFDVTDDGTGSPGSRLLPAVVSTHYAIKKQ